MGKMSQKKGTLFLSVEMVDTEEAKMAWAAIVEMVIEGCAFRTDSGAILQKSRRQSSNLDLVE
jgi:hypothetical protein